MNAEFADVGDTNDPLDDAFPMLTEVVGYEAPAPIAQPASPMPPAATVPSASAMPPASPPQPTSGEARDALERRIAAQVLDRLADSPDLLADATREALRAAADRIAAAAAAELQLSIEQTLGKLVAPAIREAVHDALAPVVHAAVRDACAAALQPAGGSGATGPFAGSGRDGTL